MWMEEPYRYRRDAISLIIGSRLNEGKEGYTADKEMCTFTF